MTIPVTAIIFTLNEEINLPHCLASLKDFDEVIVIDSFSVDATQRISEKFGAGFYQNTFEGFGTQRNWAIDNVPIRNDWVLILDADERVPPNLADEIGRRVGTEPGIGAYQVRRRLYFWGRWLRYSSLYPNWVVRLINKKKVRYKNRGHAETQAIEGVLGSLEHDLIDENHKDIDDWFERQRRYATKEAEYELKFETNTIQWRKLLSGDPMIRRKSLKTLASRMPGRPFIYFLYAYFFRLGFLDGAAGFRFCLMKTFYQLMIVLKKIDMKWRKQ